MRPAGDADDAAEPPTSINIGKHTLGSGILMGAAVSILYISATLEWAAAQWDLTLDRLNFMLNTSCTISACHTYPFIQQTRLIIPYRSSPR